uniref:Solute carrier family 40 member n=1 Tax=Aegilops tauschii TaxID=37682 RepID=M8BPY8_AEGTA
MENAVVLREWFDRVDAAGTGNITAPPPGSPGDGERGGAPGSGSPASTPPAPATSRLLSSRFSLSPHAPYSMYDFDRNGTMSFQEFLALNKFLQKVQGVFSTLERGRGFLSLEDVYEALIKLGFSLDSPAFYTVCESFDKSKKGMVRLDEFISICIFVQSARMWEFSVGLYMIRVWPGSLLFAAVYGVVESAFGPMVGTLVDSLTYLQVLGLWLLVQSLSFIVAGISVTVLLVYDDLKVTSLPVFVALVVVTNVSGALAALSTLAGTILIEREWVVVMCGGHPPAVLTRTNSAIRRIDLSCKLLAPVLSGFLISFVSAQASAVALALWNVASVWLVYWLFVSVYNGVPALGANSLARLEREADDAALSPALLGVLGRVREAGGVAARGCSRHPLLLRAKLWDADDGDAGLGGHPGWCCLLLCVGSVWVGGRVASAWVLMAGVAASRLGLWMFDLAVTQLMQDGVPDADRCAVGGVQSSLQSVFDLLTYVMGIIVSDPRDFGELIALSFLLVTCAAAMYTLHVYRVRKHLFHLDKIFAKMQ